MSGWMFLLVPAHPDRPGQMAIKRSCVCCCRNRYVAFVKMAAYQFQQLRLKKMAEEHAAEQVRCVLCVTDFMEIYICK